MIPAAELEFFAPFASSIQKRKEFGIDLVRALKWRQMMEFFKDRVLL